MCVVPNTSNNILEIYLPNMLVFLVCILVGVFLGGGDRRGWSF